MMKKILRLIMAKVRENNKIKREIQQLESRLDFTNRMVMRNILDNYEILEEIKALRCSNL